jgi:hypothetical protein
MAKTSADKFANIAALQVTETAANTQTAGKFAFPFSIMDKMGLIINRIEYWLATSSRMNTDTDSVQMALTAAAALTDISKQNDPLLIDSISLTRTDFGVAASGIMVPFPIIKDFSSLPGGGILVAPSPLYGMIMGGGCSAANVMWIKLFYTYVELSAEEFWQLVESRRIISN